MVIYQKKNQAAYHKHIRGNCKLTKCEKQSVATYMFLPVLKN